jgi:hypothetical protein
VQIASILGICERFTPFRLVLIEGRLRVARRREPDSVATDGPWIASLNHRAADVDSTSCSPGIRCIARATLTVDGAGVGKLRAARRRPERRTGHARARSGSGPWSEADDPGDHATAPLDYWIDKRPPHFPLTSQRRSAPAHFRARGRRSEREDGRFDAIAEDEAVGEPAFARFRELLERRPHSLRFYAARCLDGRGGVDGCGHATGGTLLTESRTHNVSDEHDVRDPGPGATNASADIS